MRIFSLPSIRFLGLLLGADCVFMAITAVYQFTDLISFDFYSIDTDRGYGEVFQYIKEFWIILLLFLLYLRNRQWIYLIWCFLFGYLLMDDFFMIHENMGELAADFFHFLPHWGLRAKDFGELLVSCFFGFPLLLIISVIYCQSSLIHKRIVKTLFFMCDQIMN